MFAMASGIVRIRRYPESEWPGKIDAVLAIEVAAYNGRVVPKSR